jgi:hypothetical protein
MDANEEFRELMARSGWKNQSEVARRLELPAPSVSRYVNNEDKPDKQTLRLFRLLIAGDGESPAVKPALRESPPGYAVEDLLAAVDDAHENIQRIKRLASKLKPVSSKVDSGSMIQVGPHGEISYSHPRRAKKSATPPSPVPVPQPKA